MTLRTHPHKVRDLMSRGVITMRATDKVAQAAREMSVAGIRHMPVVDAHERVVGIVSSHDLVGALSHHREAELGSLMSGHVSTVHPETRAEEAVGLMMDLKVNALPVIDKAGALVGIITATDFLAVAHQALTGASLEREAGEL